MFNWLVSAAQKGHLEAMADLGRVYASTQSKFTFCKPDRSDKANGFLWLTAAAERGHALAQCHLGRLYRSVHNKELALKWFTEAGKNGIDVQADLKNIEDHL